MRRKSQLSIIVFLLLTQTALAISADYKAQDRPETLGTKDQDKDEPVSDDDPPPPPPPY